MQPSFRKQDQVEYLISEFHNNVIIVRCQCYDSVVPSAIIPYSCCVLHFVVCCRGAVQYSQPGLPLRRKYKADVALNMGGCSCRRFLKNLFLAWPTSAVALTAHLALEIGSLRYTVITEASTTAIVGKSSCVQNSTTAKNDSHEHCLS